MGGWRDRSVIAPRPSVSTVRNLVRSLLSHTAYLITALPLALIAFVCVIVPFALGVGLSVVWVGLPVVALALAVARTFGEVERRRLVGLGRATPRQHADAAPSGRFGLTRLRQPQGWLALLHVIVGLPISILTFVVAVVWWSVFLTGITSPLHVPLLRNIGGGEDGLARLLGLSNTTGTEVLVELAVGVVFGLTLPLVLRALVEAQAGLSSALLTGVDDLQGRIDALAVGRDAAVHAEADALRRLERDIHDGPQQRLVSLAMDLGTAQRRIHDDPQRAEELVASAIAASKDTLEELRALSRGIAPPVLTDRGLESAVAALAGRSPVPVSLRLDVPQRLPAAIESTVYFVAAECLSNVAKHSGADRCTLAIADEPGSGALVLEVSDDGHGGATLQAGHGLAGLAERLRAVDGSLAISSPPGGPTTIRAEVPCG